MPPIQFLADHRDAGNTVAAMQRARFKLTWTQAKRLEENGHVRVAGMGCSDPTTRIKKNNRVWIRDGVIENTPLPPGLQRPKLPKPAPPVKPPPKAKAQPKKDITPKPTVQLPIGMELVYSDDAVVVVNKPAGLTTMRHAEEAAEFGHRGMSFLPKTLADYLPYLLGNPNRRVIAVHRIDRDTSGLVVFALTKNAATELTKQFRKHTVERRYLALVRGVPKDGRIESTLIRDRGDGRRGSTTDTNAEDGKHAVTHVKVVEPFGQFALVECRLETGRTHQVRIHLGEAGHPLCGETVYDRPPNGKPLPDGSKALRPMLHAAKLGFTHPESGTKMSWDAPTPKDFAELRKRLQTVVSG